MSDSQPQRGNVNISGGETNISGDLVGTKIVNLPPQPQPPSGSALPRRRQRKFVPRGKIMGDVREALKVGSAAIVGMHGMGGVGKTELAKFLAGELENEFKDGVLWIEVSNRPIEIVQGEMARTLGIKLPDGSDDRGRYATLCAALSGARALFVFDDVRKNFPLEWCLPPAPCSALVTSRLHELLGVDKKFVLDVMTPEQALELLRGEGLTEVIAKEAEAAATLCKSCAYHPLALVLAASRLRLRGATPLATFNNQLQDRIKQLRVDRDDKDASLEANFDLSYDELSAESKGRWRKLAVFAPSGFALPAVRHLWSESEVDANEHLYELENASLVSPSPLREERMSLHDLLRDYAFKKLHEANEGDAANRAHADYLIQLFSANYNIYDHNIPLITPEIDNLIEVTHWAVKRNELRLLGALATQTRNWMYVVFDSAWDKWWQWLHLSLQTEDKQLKANVLQAIGDVQQFRKDMDAALKSYEQALNLFRAVGDKLGEANVLAAMSRLALRKGDMALAEKNLEGVIAMRRAIGSLYDEGADYGNFSVALLNMGKKAEAKKYALKAKSVFEKIGKPSLIKQIDGLIAACD